MLLSKRSPLASTSTTEKTPITSTHTTASPHNSSFHSKDNLNIDRKDCDNKQTTDIVKTLLYARVHGAILAGFIWSVWCCDHYRMTPLITISVLFAGVLYFLWWFRRSSTTASSISSSPRPFSSKATDDFVTHPSRATREGGGGGTQDPVVSGPPPSILSPSILALASVAAASVSACSVPSAITISVLATQDHHNNNNSSLGMSMPPTPTDPPPPYYHNNSTNESGSDDLTNSGQCMQSAQSDVQLQQMTARSRQQQQRFSRQRLVIHVWGAGASLLGLISWTIASRSDSLPLSWLSPILEAENLLLLVPFSLWCWIVVTCVWFLYVMATFLLLSRGVLTRYLDVDVDGAGSGVGTSSEQQLLIEEANVSTIHKERETGLKKEQAERTEQESCVKNVDTEELSEIRQDMGGAQQHIVANAPSLKMLRQSASYRQTADRSSYKGGNSDAIMIKRHRRGPTTTPTKTAHKTWTTSVSLLQQVKHEMQFWSFSLWVLAPTIPRSFNQHHHRPQPQTQQHSTNRNDDKEIPSQVPCHPQQYGPVEMKHGGLLSTASSPVPCKDMDEFEYDLVLSEEAPRLDRHLASSAIVVATKQGDEGKQLRSQDRRDGGNQGPIQELLQSEDQRSFGQLQLHRPPTRTGFMSQSMPDLHAIKRTMGPSPVASTLAWWSRMALDPERLGSIYQYYLRQRASTAKKERQTNGYGDHDDQDSTTNDDSQDGASNSNGVGNNGDDDDEAGPGMTFVFRSSTLPTVRVGLYSADQKRFWTSSGSIHLSTLPESYD